mgnify:CR=1 FL=1
MFVETKNKEDVLTGVGFMRARNYGRGEVIIPEAVVLHYTAGGKASGTISWLSENEQAYVSAHFVVDRTGVITQMVPTNLKAFHAGICHRIRSCGPPPGQLCLEESVSDRIYSRRYCVSPRNA